MLMFDVALLTNWTHTRLPASGRILKRLDSLCGKRVDKGFSVSSEFANTVKLDKYDYVNPFLDAAFIPRDRHANLFPSEKEMLYLRNIM